MTDDIRPTTKWREEKQKEADDLAAGRISEKECFMAELFPDEFINETEGVLNHFISSISHLPVGAESYPAVMDCIKLAVFDLNDINETGDGCWIDEGESDDLCAFFEEIIVRHGFDIEDLAASQDMEPCELTDEWRDW